MYGGFSRLSCVAVVVSWSQDAKGFGNRLIRFRGLRLVLIHLSRGTWTRIVTTTIDHKSSAVARIAPRHCSIVVSVCVGFRWKAATAPEAQVAVLRYNMYICCADTSHGAPKCGDGLNLGTYVC